MLFGWALLFVSAALAVLPFYFGKSDLISVRSLFMGGIGVFMGLSSVSCGITRHHYGNYRPEHFQTFMVAATVFIAVFEGTYWNAPVGYSRHGWLNKWPKTTQRNTIFIAIVSLVFVGGAIALARFVKLPFFTQMLWQIGTKSIVFPATFAVVAFFYRRSTRNLLILAGIFSACVILSISVGSGRRFLLGTLLTFPVVWYWLKYRYQPPLRTLTIALFALGVMTVLMTSYAGQRHRRGASLIQKLSNSLNGIGDTTSDLAEFDISKLTPKFGQNATECSILCIQRYGGGKKVSYFHSPIFVIANPMPRSIWPDKPDSLGNMLPRSCGVQIVNWGPGIVGHSFHEGGFFMLFVYGIGFGLVFRFCDNVMRAQSSNPFLIATLCTASGHLFGLPRGDIGIMGVQLVGTVLALVVLRFYCGASFGTQRSQNPHHRTQRDFASANSYHGRMR